MYIHNVFVTTLAAARLASACVYADESSSISAQAFHDFHVAGEAKSATTHAKRALSSMFDWLNDLLTKNGTNKGQEACPPVWSEISTALTAQFLADGQCTDAARAAIRASFHDCFNGACDGSLILADECSGFENRGLDRLCGNLGNLAQEKEVGVADLIQFAAAHAIKTCPGGPIVPVKIGRKDSNQANEQGILPGPRAESDELIKLFASKGFSPVDLAALVGAHTAAKQRLSDPDQAGASLDSTVGIWDNEFYSETLSNDAPFVLPVDKGISQNPITAIPFSTFAASKGA